MNLVSVKKFLKKFQGQEEHMFLGMDNIQTCVVFEGFFLNQYQYGKNVICTYALREY